MWYIEIIIKKGKYFNYTVVFFDIGNTYISIDSTNIYIPELINSLNENAKPKEKKNTTDTIDYDSIESLDRF